MTDHLRIYDQPDLTDGRMLMGFTGWMDGGEVSTGVLRHFVGELDAVRLADIEPGPFHIYAFPGSMEVSALFRPHTEIREGLVQEFQEPLSRFHYHAGSDLVLFEGREPNFNWAGYAEAVFEVARACDVRRIYFIGSVAGVVPHTREARLRASASSERLRDELAGMGIQTSDYQGPASIVTYLTVKAPEYDMEMATLVAEIPSYIHGKNPICIESVAKRLAALLGLEVKTDHLQFVRQVFEKKLNEVVKERTELAELIEKLESDYDNEVFDTEMGDLKDWLQRQGIRLD